MRTRNTDGGGCRAGRTAAVALALAGALSAGCMNHHNDRATLGDGVWLEAISGDEAIWRTPASDEPSLVGLNRSNWERIRYDAGVDGVAHRPTYATLHTDRGGSSRALGEYPTPLAALELEDDRLSRRAGMAVVGMGSAALEGFLIVPGLFVHPQWRTGWSPKESWEREPAWERMLPLAPEAEADAMPEAVPDDADSVGGEP